MAKQQLTPVQFNPNSLYSDTYVATAQAAAGEFVSPTRKTFDVTSIPTGHLFTVTAINGAGDGAGLRNVNTSITYNGIGYGQDSMTQYHQAVALTITLVKVSGQNSVAVNFGGSAGSQNWRATLNQIN